MTRRTQEIKRHRSSSKTGSKDDQSRSQKVIFGDDLTLAVPNIRGMCEDCCFYVEVGSVRVVYGF